MCNIAKWVAASLVLLLFGCGGGSQTAKDPLFQPTGDVYKAAQAGDIEAVREYMDLGSWDPSIANYEGILPLCAAAQGGNIEIIELMVNDGADVNMADLTGKTPIQHAKSAGHDDAVQFLLELGASE